MLLGLQNLDSAVLYICILLHGIWNHNMMEVLMPDDKGTISTVLCSRTELSNKRIFLDRLRSS